MTNTDLWDRVKVTDPSAVKKITGKAYQGNSPKPYWLIQRATEEFGPIGIGWGVIVKAQGFQRLSETDVLHTAVVSVWFVKDGVRSECFDQMGGTKASYLTSKGVLMVDEDAGKKSVTDGMVKCLSMLGFAGDIFSGMWDDSKYVEWAAEQYADDSKSNVHPIVTGARTGIGDDLPQDWKDYLQDLAQEATEYVKAGNLAAALEAINRNKLDSEQRVYLENQLDSKTRSALKQRKQQ